MDEGDPRIAGVLGLILFTTGIFLLTNIGWTFLFAGVWFSLAYMIALKGKK